MKIDGMHTPKFDPSKIIEGLRYKLHHYLGGPVMRMAGPELEDFLEYEVRDALLSAYQEAEFRWQRDQIEVNNEYSLLMLKSALAGAELGAKSERKKKGEG